MDLIREVMLVRYRELYGTTLGDPRSVVRADVGRGVSIYLWNLPAERRLPLRAYVAGLTLKNGVPINYIEAIGLFEWMEVGFNTFYTFRGGEVAWIFAQVLRCLCSLMGTTCISMYPYQLGHKNQEAIDSGAFWFYRKLGFRPGASRPGAACGTRREHELLAILNTERLPELCGVWPRGTCFTNCRGAKWGPGIASQRETSAWKSMAAWARNSAATFNTSEKNQQPG